MGEKGKSCFIIFQEGQVDVILHCVCACYSWRRLQRNGEDLQEASLHQHLITASKNVRPSKCLQSSKQPFGGDYFQSQHFGDLDWRGHEFECSLSYRVKPYLKEAEKNRGWGYSSQKTAHLTFCIQSPILPKTH